MEHPLHRPFRGIIDVQSILASVRALLVLENRCFPLKGSCKDPGIYFKGVPCSCFGAQVLPIAGSKYRVSLNPEPYSMMPLTPDANGLHHLI